MGTTIDKAGKAPKTATQNNSAAQASSKNSRGGEAKEATAKKSKARKKTSAQPASAQETAQQPAKKSVKGTKDAKETAAPKKDNKAYGFAGAAGAMMAGPMLTPKVEIPGLTPATNVGGVSADSFVDAASQVSSAASSIAGAGIQQLQSSVSNIANLFSGKDEGGKPGDTAQQTTDHLLVDKTNIDPSKNNPGKGNPAWYYDGPKRGANPPALTNAAPEAGKRTQRPNSVEELRLTGNVRFPGTTQDVPVKKHNGGKWLEQHFKGRSNPTAGSETEDFASVGIKSANVDLGRNLGLIQPTPSTRTNYFGQPERPPYQFTHDPERYDRITNYLGQYVLREKEKPAIAPELSPEMEALMGWMRANSGAFVNSLFANHEAASVSQPAISSSSQQISAPAIEASADPKGNLPGGS